MSRLHFARRLRRDMTDAEQKLWSRLRNRQLRSMKFRRQLVIENFIADFVCVEARLVVELDGSQHAEATEADRLRSDAIETAGYLILRFWNHDVLTNIDGVLEEINQTLAARPSPAPEI